MREGYCIDFGWQSELEYIPMIYPRGQIFIEINEKYDCVDECLDALWCEHFYNGMIL